MLNNSVFLAGRISSDPSFRQSEDGTDLSVFFTIAVDKRRRRNRNNNGNGDGRKNDPYFIPCVKFLISDRQREFFHSFKKGEPVIITGNIYTYSRDDKDGKRTYGWNVNVDEIQRQLANPRGHMSPALDAGETLIGEDDVLQEEELPFT